MCTHSHTHTHISAWGTVRQGSADLKTNSKRNQNYYPEHVMMGWCMCAHTLSKDSPQNGSMSRGRTGDFWLVVGEGWKEVC